MKILLASSEVHPYSKTGGLADMVAALAKSLGKAGHQVGLVTPLYRGVFERFPAITKFDWWLDVPLGPYRATAEVWTTQPSPGVTIYFIHRPEFYDRASLYTEGGHDYSDNSQRFIFFSKCVAHLARYLPWQPQLVHPHDWQTGLVPILILHQKLTEGWWNAPRSCFTIHNLAYQGHFPRKAYEFTNLPLDYFNPNGVEFYGGLNCLKAGISYADVVTTVSPRYAREITSPEFGCTLDGALRARQAASALVGILNGVDYEEWSTTHDPFLKHHYDVRDLTGKALNKAELQTELGLPVQSDVPLFASITRLVDQKGVDIQLGALEEMLAANIQFVLLGSGSAEFERAYQNLARRFSQKVAVRIGFDVGLSHRIEAGADFFLMPSRYEPSGLNQMYSLHYGTIPIVRITGGLDDSVTDAAVDIKHADGIKFSEYSVRALSKAIRKALVLYENPKWLNQYRRNAMRVDFSWEHTAAQYVELYNGIIGKGG